MTNLATVATTQVMNDAYNKLLRLREVKREASRRCRARQKAIASGQLLTPELMVRSLQPKAMMVENFKIAVGNKTVRLNRNGGEKVALVVSENGQTTRKSFKNIFVAAKQFNVAVTA